MSEIIIIVDRGVISQIEKEHKIERHAVSNALKGDESVPKYNLIRAVALNKKGREYQPVKKKL